MMMMVVVMIVNLQSASNISGKAILSHGTYWGNHLAVHIEIDQDTKAEKQVTEKRFDTLESEQKGQVDRYLMFYAQSTTRGHTRAKQNVFLPQVKF